ncbi:hypothetical protein H0W91_01625 [Patescibacteria group bacterium]|nr:hypothetical protein [Patescibacteria group bacterium]
MGLIMIIPIAIVIFIVLIISVVINNNSNNMDSNKKLNAKDFFLNIGSIIALYTLVYSLVNLLFTVINTKFPQINSYNYLGSQSISFPVATLIIFFPIFILLMWLLERSYIVEPEKQTIGIHRWLTYLTLFIAGLVLAGDLITVLYYFIDGQELGAGFLLKVLVLLVISSAIFGYYLSDIRGTLTSKSRKIWRIVAGVIVIGSIAWGFSVLGSPRTQQLYKYDLQKVSDLQNISNQLNSYYYNTGTLPQSFGVMSNGFSLPNFADPQTKKPYEYKIDSNNTYELCAEFNKSSKADEINNKPYMIAPAYPGGNGILDWSHPAGHFCFNGKVSQAMRGEPTNKSGFPGF